jgi:hypothetical protein
MSTLTRIVTILLPWFCLGITAQYVTGFAGAALWIVAIALSILWNKRAGRPANPMAFLVFAVVVLLTLNGYLHVVPWAETHGVTVCYGAFALAALVSVAVRAPFSSAYARTQVPPALWQHPVFLRVNSVVSLAWALVFAGNTVLSLILRRFWWVQVATYSLLAGALAFSDLYPARIQRRHPPQNPS